MNIILASTSVSRRKILQKLAIPFQCIAPICDETPLDGETAEQLVTRLSMTKAQSLVATRPNSLIIGSDQVGMLDGQIIGKPLTRAKAIHQLKQSCGKSIDFYTGLTVINSQTLETNTLYEPFKVTFRALTDEEIIAYVDKEQPLHCAGSFKCDELGITLFEKLEGNDLNSLIGLPLIKLNKILIEMGYNPLLQK